MPGLVSFFLRLICADGRRYRRRGHGVAGLRRFRRRMQAVRRFARGGHRAAGRGHGIDGHTALGARRAHRHIIGAAARAPSVNMGLDPWLVAGPSAPTMHGAAAAPPPPGSPPPPPTPPAVWLAPSTPTPAGEEVVPSRGPPSYAPVPMRVMVDEEAASGFVSAPTGATGVVRLGVGMDGADTSAPPPLETAAGSSSHAKRRFGRLFGRAVAAIDRRPGRRASSWAPVRLGLASSAPEVARPDAVFIGSSSDEESSAGLCR
ncbi:hypothetical protein ZWY2020_032438 [Hordeum vulgare]|nr:hypothetical protein ZWY2020_032438 [Hordeum vulgare]